MTEQALEPTLLTSEDQLSSIRDDWSELLRQSSSNEPMQSPIWLTRWWQVYGPQDQRELCVLALRRDGKLVGLVFDGNIHSISGSYWFDSELNRTVAVHPEVMLESLHSIYEADYLLEEMGIR